jgi:hypothetical protein
MAIWIPVASWMPCSRLVAGLDSPCTQSFTVGADTFSCWARAVWVRSGLASSHFLRLSMDGVLGHSYYLAIGHSSAVRRDNSPVPKATTRTFWSRVEEALRERGLPTTQVYVARFLKIKPPSVNEWTRLGGYPTIDNTISLAEHLGVNSEWLLTERGPKRPLPPDVTAQRLWDMWSRLSEGDKHELVGMASGMLRRSNPNTAADRRRA